MNVLFITLLDIESLSEHNIYTDLLREFQKNNDRIYLVSPSERKKGFDTRIIKDGECTVLKPKIGNTQKTNIIEKGISTLLLEPTIKKTIKKYFSDIKFDIVIYSTPPITFCSVIEYVKNKTGAEGYLLLKDIFPQNAVDLQMMSKSNPIYKYFRHKEKRLYKASDHIGCMSEANKQYLLSNNSYISPDKVEICPNSIEVFDRSISPQEKRDIREKYGLPKDKLIFIYGGNLGKPQGVDFIIEALKAQAQNDDVFYFIVGSGTEYEKFNSFVKSSNQRNIKLFPSLPKEEYDNVVSACDVGLIFLDYRFSIPNFPSRLLSYMQSKLPILAATDTVCDMGKIAEENGFGIYCPSNDTKAFCRAVEKLTHSDLSAMGQCGFEYLCNNYSASVGYRIISKHFK